MFRKLANLQARTLRRQANQWEQHPYRTLLVAVVLQVALQTAARELRRRAEKSAQTTTETIHVQYEDLDEGTKQVVREVLKQVAAPLN